MPEITAKAPNLESGRMTFTQMLAATSQARQSLLCVGLDPDPARFPAGMTPAAESFFDFCAAIVDATADVATAFKPQIAYFVAYGAERQLVFRILGGEDLVHALLSNLPGGTMGAFISVMLVMFLAELVSLVLLHVNCVTAAS